MCTMKRKKKWIVPLVVGLIAGTIIFLVVNLVVTEHRLEDQLARDYGITSVDVDMDLDNVTWVKADGSAACYGRFTHYVLVERFCLPIVQSGVPQ
jgi:hypothetical protein